MENKIRNVGEIVVLGHLCELRKIYGKMREASNKLSKKHNFRKYGESYKF